MVVGVAFRRAESRLGLDVRTVCLGKGKYFFFQCPQIFFKLCVCVNHGRTKAHAKGQIPKHRRTLLKSSFKPWIFCGVLEKLR